MGPHVPCGLVVPHCPLAMGSAVTSFCGGNTPKWTPIVWTLVHCCISGISGTTTVAGINNPSNHNSWYCTQATWLNLSIIMSATHLRDRVDCSPTESSFMPLSYVTYFCAKELFSEFTFRPNGAMCTRRVDVSYVACSLVGAQIQMWQHLVASGPLGGYQATCMHLENTHGTRGTLKDRTWTTCL